MAGKAEKFGEQTEEHSGFQRGHRFEKNFITYDAPLNGLGCLILSEVHFVSFYQKRLNCILRQQICLD